MASAHLPMLLHSVEFTSVVAPVLASLTVAFRIVAADHWAFTVMFAAAAVLKLLVFFLNDSRKEENARAVLRNLVAALGALVYAWAFVFNLLSDPAAVQSNPGLLLSNATEFAAGLLRWSPLLLGNLDIALYAESFLNRRQTSFSSM